MSTGGAAPPSVLWAALEGSTSFRVAKALWLAFGGVSLVCVFTFYCCCISMEDKLRYRSGIRSVTGKGKVRLFDWQKNRVKKKRS